MAQPEHCAPQTASEAEAIPNEAVPFCSQCGQAGTPLYAGLSDRLFGVPGVWGHSQCSQCGLVWLNPRPRPEALSMAYRTYYTHGRRRRFATLQQNMKRGLFATVPGYEGIARGPIWRTAGSLLTRLPSWNERAVLGTMCLNGSQKGTLLDVGCGDGEFLSLMRDAGWEVMGVEPDPVAATRAERAHSVRVIAGDLQDARMPDASVDAVTLSHVIEHAADPLGMLQECRRLLKPQGKIIVVTPNLAGWGSRVFRDCWVHLDPPRHLYLFSPSTLRRCCEEAGLRVERLRTSARTAAWVWAASDSIRQKGSFRREFDLTWRRRIEGAALQVHEQFAQRSQDCDPLGEELVLIAGLETSANPGIRIEVEFASQKGGPAPSGMGRGAEA